MTNVADVVERAIALARTVKLASPHRFDDARVALLKIADVLRKEFPQHPALKRLLEYLAESDSPTIN